MKLLAESLALTSVNYAWPLPEVNSTTVRDLTGLSVSSLPLSVVVRSHIQSHSVDPSVRSR